MNSFLLSQQIALIHFSFRGKWWNTFITSCGIQKHSNSQAQPRETHQIDDEPILSWEGIVKTKHRSPTSLAFIPLVLGTDRVAAIFAFSIQFLVQFGSNLHEWVFQRAKIAQARRAIVIWAFWKTHRYKSIPNWMRELYDSLLTIIHEKICQVDYKQSLFLLGKWRSLSEYCIWTRFTRSLYHSVTRSLCHCFAPFLLVFLQSAD